MSWLGLGLGLVLGLGFGLGFGFGLGLGLGLTLNPNLLHVGRDDGRLELVAQPLLHLNGHSVGAIGDCVQVRWRHCSLSLASKQCGLLPHLAHRAGQSKRPLERWVAAWPLWHPTPGHLGLPVEDERRGRDDDCVHAVGLVHGALSQQRPEHRDGLQRLACAREQRNTVQCTVVTRSATRGAVRGAADEARTEPHVVCQDAALPERARLAAAAALVDELCTGAGAVLAAAPTSHARERAREKGSGREGLREKGSGREGLGAHRDALTLVRPQLEAEERVEHHVHLALAAQRHAGRHPWATPASGTRGGNTCGGKRDAGHGTRGGGTRGGGGWRGRGRGG